MGVVLRRPRAEEDLIDIWLYIARDKVSAADKVMDAIEETVRLLADQPDIGVRHVSTLEALADLRFFPAKRFRQFLIFYRPVPDGIEIVRVLRGQRDYENLLAEDV